jgi:hypothetical protein
VISAPNATCLLGQDQPFRVIGERINPTGKKKLQAELREGKFGMVRQYAGEQLTAGAAILDVNMGLSGIDEKAMMLDTVSLLAQGTALPLCIDSTDSEVIEAALRLYPGRALVNSISAEKDAENLVIFEPFVGVGPRSFFNLFSMNLGNGNNLKRKNIDGETVNWNAESSKLRVQMLPCSYIELEALAAKNLFNKLRGDNT